MPTLSGNEEAVDWKYLYKPWCDSVKEMSGGRLVVTPYLAGALVATGEMTAALKKGAVEAIGSTPSYMEGEVPEAAIESAFPTGFDSQEDAMDFFHKFKDGAAVKILQKLYEKKGFHRTAFGRTVMIYMSTKPINTVSDIKGMKLRTMTPPVVKHLQAMGGVPVAIAPAEVYTGLQRGTIDGAIAPINLIAEQKLWEVLGYMLTEPPIIPPQGVGPYINLTAYNSLPADLQQICDQAAKKLVLEQYYPKAKEADSATIRSAKEHGMKATTLTGAELQKFKDAAKPILDDYQKVSAEAAELYGLWKAFYAEKGITK